MEIYGKKIFFYEKFLHYQIQFSESAIMNFQDHAAAYEGLQTGRLHFT